MRFLCRKWPACLALLACLGAASAVEAASLVTEDHVVSASNGAAGEDFGVWVDIDGSRAIVGARYADDPFFPGNPIGAAYVYDFNGTSWAQSAQLVPTYADWSSRVGEYVAIQGNTAVICAPYQSTGTAGTEGGAAWVFEYEGGTWIEKATLRASDGAPGDHFGGVAIGGDNIVIAAGLADVDGLSNVGAAYVYNRNQGGPGAWGEVQKLTMAEPVAESRMTYVAIDDGTIVAGAYWDSGNAAYVFQYDDLFSTWSQAARLTGNGGRFGSSVDVRGDLIAVGAYNNSEGYLFVRDEGGPGAWGQVARLSATSDGNVGRGAAIIDESTVVFSGHTVDVQGQADAGAAFVFRKDQTGQWNETNMLVAGSPAAGDNLGGAIAASGHTLLAGARLGDGNVANTGTAYMFSVPATDTPIPPLPTPGHVDGGPVVVGGTTPYAWYRADRGVIASTEPYFGETTVLYWADQSGNDRHVSVEKGNPEQTNSAPNGETTLTFDGTDVLVGAPDEWGTAAPGTIIAVWSPTGYDPRHADGVTYVYDANDADYRQFLSYATKKSSATPPLGQNIEAGARDAAESVFNLANVETANIPGGDGDVLDEWLITTVTMTTGIDDVIHVNGTELFSGDLLGTGMKGLVIGADRRRDRYEFQGHFAELIVFEGELSLSEIQAVEQTLMTR